MYVPNNACAISKCLRSLDNEIKGPSLKMVKAAKMTVRSTDASELATDETSALRWALNKFNHFNK